jgi:hypothetical protein
MNDNKKIEERVKSLENIQDLFKKELDYTLFNGLLFSASIRTLMDFVLPDDESRERFNKSLEINLKLIEEDFKQQSENARNDGS